MTNHETPQRGYAYTILDDADKKKQGRLSALIMSPQQQTSPREQSVRQS